MKDLLPQTILTYLEEVVVWNTPLSSLASTTLQQTVDIVTQNVEVTNFLQLTCEEPAFGSSTGFSSFFMFIVFVVAIFGILSYCSRQYVHTTGGQQAGAYGSGFGNTYPGGYGFGGHTGGYGGGYGGYSYPSSSTGFGGGGFFSGLATGGLLSYLLRPRFFLC